MLNSSKNFMWSRMDQESDSYVSLVAKHDFEGFIHFPMDSFA